MQESKGWVWFCWIIALAIGFYGKRIAWHNELYGEWIVDMIIVSCWGIAAGYCLHFASIGLRYVKGYLWPKAHPQSHWALRPVPPPIVMTPEDTEATRAIELFGLKLFKLVDNLGDNGTRLAEESDDLLRAMFSHEGRDPSALLPYMRALQERQRDIGLVLAELQTRTDAWVESQSDTDRMEARPVHA